MRSLAFIFIAFLLVLVLGHTHCLADVRGSAGAEASSRGISSSCELCDLFCSTEENCPAKINGGAQPTASPVPPMLVAFVGMPERTITRVASEIFAPADRARPLYEFHSILLI
jgi:hypothetical protein